MVSFQSILLCLVVTLKFPPVKLITNTLCSDQWPVYCDPNTWNRVCQLFQHRILGKCAQIVFDSQQNTLIALCFMAFLHEIQSSVLVRTPDRILEQNIFDNDDNYGMKKRGVYKHCRTIVVLSDDSSLWLNLLDNSRFPVTMSRKRFYPFVHIFIVSQTKPVLLGHHSDYMFINLLQLYWLQVDIDRNESEVDSVRITRIEHLPTNFELVFDNNATESFRNEIEVFLRHGKSNHWKSFHYTKAFRSSQTNCVPYVIPIYNKNGSIKRLVHFFKLLSQIVLIKPAP